MNSSQHLFLAAHKFTQLFTTVEFNRQNSYLVLRLHGFMNRTLSAFTNRSANLLICVFKINNFIE